MEIAQIQAFVEADRRGSFRRAAKALFLSQPSLSNRIRLLEKELGVKLFHRRGNGVVLTDTGRAFLPYAQRALTSLRDARQVVATSQNATGGVVTISASRVVSAYVLPEILDRLRVEYPETRASVTVSRSREVLEAVASGQVQLGLSRGLVHPEVDTRLLFDEDLVLTVHPRHSLASKTHVQFTDLAVEPLILYDAGSSYTMLIEQVFKEAGIVPRVEMSLDGVDAVKRMVELNMGISFLPRSAVRRENEDGSLKIVLLPPQHRMVLPTCLLVRRSQRYSDTVRMFISVLQAIYGN